MEVTQVPKPSSFFSSPSPPNTRSPDCENTPGSYPAGIVNAMMMYPITPSSGGGNFAGAKFCTSAPYVDCTTYACPGRNKSGSSKTHSDVSTMKPCSSPTDPGSPVPYRGNDPHTTGASL